MNRRQEESNRACTDCRSTKEENKRSAVKKMILMAAAILLVSVAGAQDLSGYHYEDAIQVNGKAEKKVTPDEIYVAITLRDGDTKGQTVNQLESRLKSELQAMGIDVASALKVTSQNIAPRKKTDADTRRSYELKVGDTWILGSVFELLGEMGVTQAGVTKVSHSKIDEFRKEVRIAAVKDAKQTATVIAEAVGQSIGNAVWIFDNGYYESSPMPMVRYAKAEMAMDSVYAAGTAEQGIDMQEITITYNISVKFILNRK